MSKLVYAKGDLSDLSDPSRFCLCPHPDGQCPGPCPYLEAQEPIQVLVVLGTVERFGPPVQSLEQARVVAKLLDWMFENDCLPQQVAGYTPECDIEAVQGDKRWSYKDQDPSGASDGIWDREE